MTRIHLLRVDAEPSAFAALVTALEADGARLGWLDWAPERAASPLGGAFQSLEAAADLPALRAVAVEDGRSVAIKPRRGAPVLRDIVREYFRGCRVVLVRGRSKGLEEELPLLKLDSDAYRVLAPGFDRSFDAESLAARLRRPRPFE